MKRFAPVLALTFSLAPLTAQKTWVVDASGGGNFRTLSAAFAGAKNGDTLRVRRGMYPGAQVTKGLRVLGEPGATIEVKSPFTANTPIIVNGLPAGQTFVLRGFAARSSSVVSASTIDTAFFAQDCAGQILIEDCDFVQDYRGNRASTESVILRRCARVTMRACSMMPGAVITSSTVIASECDFFGLSEYRPPQSFFSKTPSIGIQARSSTLVLAHCNIAGGGASIFQSIFKPLPAIEAFQSQLVIAGAKRLSAGNTGIPMIRGSSYNVLYDTRLQTEGSPFAGAMQVHRTRLNSTLVEHASQAGQVRARIDGMPKAAYALLAGFDARPTILAGIGQLWLDPASILVLQSGQLDQAGRAAAAIPVTNLPSGLPIYLQTLFVTPGPGLDLSAATGISPR